MGERAKIIVNEYIAKEMLYKDNLDVDKLYSSDLRILVKAANKEIEKLTEELRLQGLKLEDTKKELIEQDKYIDKLKIEYDKKLELERQIKKEVREYIETHLDNTFKTEFDYITTNPQELLEILDKVEGDKE